MKRKWMLRRNKADTAKMAQVLGVSEPIAYIMANRGIGTYQAAMKFLYCDLQSMANPYGMKDMKKAAGILKDAVTARKKIVVYGDYDVDGVMSTTILYKGLKELGASVEYYIPHRQKEGYGLNCDAVKKLKENGMEVLLTCDNGIAADKEIRLAKELGVLVVVIDHHEPACQMENKMEEIIPPADAVIDPKQKSCSYPFQQLCAGGLSYFFICVLFQVMRKENKNHNEYLSLAAIATICDVVDLIDENRILVKKGLPMIQNPANIGLKALIESTGVEKTQIDEGFVGFTIGPCINATGRLESAALSIQLFLEENETAARAMAEKLVALNEERKRLTKEATSLVLDRISEDEMDKDGILVIYHEDVHESIAGIVAGRVKEAYYKPVIVITKAEQDAKGSARSIEGFDIFQALSRQKQLFTKFGGHAMAAGFSLPFENIALLRKNINEENPVQEEIWTQVMKIDKQLNPEDITISLAKEVSLLAPFGKGNPSPLFGGKGFLVRQLRFLGKEGKTLKFTFAAGSGGRKLEGISFGAYDMWREKAINAYGADFLSDLEKGRTIPFLLDIVFELQVHAYMGMENVQLLIRDFRFTEK